MFHSDEDTTPSLADLETAAYLAAITLERVEPHQVKRIVIDLIPKWTWQGRALKDHGGSILEVGELVTLPGPGNLPWKAREVKINRPKGFNQDARSETLHLWVNSRDDYQVQL